MNSLKNIFGANLAAWWPLAEGSGTTITDRIGALGGSLVSSTWVPGKIGNGIQHTGTQYTNLNAPALMDFGTGDWTLAAWFKRISTTVTGPQPLFNKDNPNINALRQFALLLDGVEDNSNKIMIIYFHGTTAYQYATETAASSNDMNWHHVCAGRIGSGLQIIVDGVARAAPVVGSSGTMRATGSPCILGRRIASPGSAAGEVIISQPMILNRAITEKEASILYNARKLAGGL